MRAPEPHLVPPLEAGLGCLAALLHGLHEDAEAALAAPQQVEEERGLPGGFLEGDLPPFGLGGAGDVQQSQMTFHPLNTGRGGTRTLRFTHQKRNQ